VKEKYKSPLQHIPSIQRGAPLMLFPLSKIHFLQGLVTYACNLSYSYAEIRRMTVQNQSRQIVPKSLSYKKNLHKEGLVECSRA
jgi:hypothetical protein